MRVELAARVLVATWREAGLAGCARKLRAAVWMGLPVLVCGRRTAQSVGAYFDLITDDARLFYGDSFHLGYFLTPPIDRGQETRCYLRDPDGHLIEVGQSNQADRSAD